jgi:pimeloyl-ACP methyl ester carboxylesterase
MALTPALSIAYEETGDAQGFPVILLHGFPDDARAYDNVVARLAKQGYRAIVPYLRGYGQTRFRDASAPRMAEQAAIGQDVIDLAAALKIPRFAVAGYDWGGRF